jgi:hypothetical protein
MDMGAACAPCRLSSGLMLRSIARRALRCVSKQEAGDARAVVRDARHSAPVDARERAYGRSYVLRDGRLAPPPQDEG